MLPRLVSARGFIQILGMENSFDSSTSCFHNTTDGHSPGPRVSSLAGFQGQTKGAYEIVTRMHAGGDRTSPLVEFEMEEMICSIQLERELKTSTGWGDIISTEDNRKRLFISPTIGVFAQWNGVGLFSYYLSPILKSVGVNNVAHITIINGCLQIWILFFAVCAALMVDKVRQRTLFLTSSIDMLCPYIVVTGLSGSFAVTKHGGVGIAVIPFLYAFYTFYDIAFTPLLVSYEGMAIHAAG